MNHNNAGKIAKTITNEQLREMLQRAKNTITNWAQPSAVNKGMTKGTAWNVLAADFNVEKEYPYLARKNMIWEFGDYLPEDLKPQQKEKRSIPSRVHQEPKFANWE